MPDRAFQDREITYWLQPPATHAFDIAHDYTEGRVGTDRYVNIVRGGSRVSKPGATVLDSGAGARGGNPARRGHHQSRHRHRRPGQRRQRGRGGALSAVKAGEATRLRITETYTDPSRYGLVGDVLVWRRSFGRPRNVVVLPDGWYLTANAVPATIDRDDRGRLRLTYVNPRNDEIDVLIRAARR